MIKQGKRKYILDMFYAPSLKHNLFPNICGHDTRRHILVYDALMNGEILDCDEDLKCNG